MLSAVAQRLKDIRTAKTAERQRSTIDLCYQAYPDLRPWQVKEICVESTGPITIGSENDLADLYYSYLSLLLHPTDGHDGARHDTSLVEEYCALSVKTNGEETTQKKQNFLQVASKTSSNHLAYVRNLPFLLKLSMNAQEYNLALDLGKWNTLGILLWSPLANRSAHVVTTPQQLRRFLTLTQTSIPKNLSEF